MSELGCKEFQRVKHGKNRGTKGMQGVTRLGTNLIQASTSGSNEALGE